MDEIAIVRDVDRHADIDAGRPARLVRGMGVAAIEDVKAIDARGRLRVAWRGDKQCRERGEGEACELHGRSSLGSAQYARLAPAQSSKDRELTRAIPGA